jgi:hypothetical protein
MPRERLFFTLPPDSDLLIYADSGTTSASMSIQNFAATNRPFEFEKRGQLFIRTHNEPPSIVTMRVTNERDFLETLNTRVRWQGASGWLARRRKQTFYGFAKQNSRGNNRQLPHRKSVARLEYIQDAICEHHK